MGMLAGGFFSQGGSGTETLALDTTITSAMATLAFTGTSPSTYYTYGYGFDAGADPFNYGSTFGSIASDTYTDGDSNSQTVTSCYSAYFQLTDIWLLYFTLETTNQPDTDATFSKIVIDGATRNRADRTTKANCTGGTYWSWNETGDLFSGANPDDFEVWVI